MLQVVLGRAKSGKEEKSFPVGLLVQADDNGKVTLSKIGNDGDYIIAKRDSDGKMKVRGTLSIDLANGGVESAKRLVKAMAESDGKSAVVKESKNGSLAVTLKEGTIIVSWSSEKIVSEYSVEAKKVLHALDHLADYEFEQVYGMLPPKEAKAKPTKVTTLEALVQ